MKTWALLLVAIWMVAGAGITTGGGEEQMGPNSSLPAETEGWKWDGQEVGYRPTNLFEYIDGAAELYLAYDFQHLTVRRFEKATRPPITLELYEMASSGDAYGVFSFERQDEPAGIGQGSEFGGGLLRFWKGKYFVSIYADGEGADVESAILHLGKDTANAIREVGPAPELVGWIPGMDFGLVEKSVRYLKSHVLLNQRFFISHQNILNLTRRTEAVLAEYVRENRKSHLLLIRYPNPQEAGDAYQHFRTAYLPDAGEKDRVRTEDQKWTMTRQRNEFFLVVLDAPTEGDGDVLLKATEEALPGAR